MITSTPARGQKPYSCFCMNSARPAMRPSDLVHQRNWKRLQFRDTPKFVCYRGPPAAAPKVPLLLLDPSFLRFVECYNNVAAPSGDDMETASKICNLLSSGIYNEKVELLAFLSAEGLAVDRLSEQLSKADGLSSTINRLLSPYLKARFTGVSMGGDEDVEFGALSGVFNHSPGVPAIVTECMEDEDPCFHMLASLHCFFRDMFPSEKTSHILGLCFMGAFVQAVAVVWDWQEGKLLAEPLTDYICCWGPKFATFERVAKLLRSVKTFYELYTPSKEGINVRIPWHVKDWAAEPLDDMVFLCRRHPRFDQQLVVVKFCENYNRDAHEAWHEQDYAPTFYEQVFLGCGWKMVTMEYLDPNQGWQDAADYASKKGKDKACLERLAAAAGGALKRGHASGFCHGDFRLENIMVKQMEGDGLCVKAVDFEYAGKTSEGTYPRILGDAISWPDGAAYGRTLEEHHDRHFVERIVADYYEPSE